MPCLLDTGVLLRAFDSASAENGAIRAALRTLWARQERLLVTLQNLAEFWNVSTRPVDKNGYGLSVERTSRRVAVIERICQVITESDRSYAIWRELLTTYALTGVAVHDARLVSVMLTHGISTIITLNERDFRRYGGIFVLTPERL